MSILHPDLERLIIRTMVKGVLFNPKENNFKVNQKSIADAEWLELVAAAAKYNIAESSLRSIVTNLENEISFAPKIVTKWNVRPEEIKIGQHLKVYEKSSQFGNAATELLCINTNKFMVLFSERNVLQLHDIIESVTMPWNASYVIDFKVFRNKNRYPDTVSLYRTFLFDKIELLNPPDIYAILDNTEIEDRTEIDAASETLYNEQH